MLLALSYKLQQVLIQDRSGGRGAYLGFCVWGEGEGGSIIVFSIPPFSKASAPSPHHQGLRPLFKIFPKLRKAAKKVRKKNIF